MKVLQILPKLDIGGVEKTVVDLASYFKDKMIVVSGGGRLVEEIEKQKATHYKLSVYKKSPLSLFAIKKLKKIIEREKIEIVHARSRVPGWLSFFATRGTDSFFITTAHGKYRPHFFSQVMGWGKAVICPSQVIARHLIENFKINEDKIHIVPRWVKLDDYKFVDPKKRLSFSTIVGIGRITPSKGWEYLIKAFHKIIRLNPYLKLKIAGDTSIKPDYFRYLKNLINRFSLNYYVEFLGFKETQKVLEKASLLVAPSVIEEAFGRVVIEGFASGVPVVASKCGALCEIIEDGKTGLLVPSKDVDALQEAILKVLNNPPFAQDLAYNAYEEVKKRYSFKEAVKKIEKIYYEVKEKLNILIIKFSSLGDLILIIPSLKAIREKFPKARITLLTLRRYVSLFYECPYIDKVIGVDKNYKKLKNLLRISFSLLKENYDYIIDFQNNLASHLIAFLSFPRYSFGYKRKLGFLLTKRIKWKKEAPLESQQKILSLLGVEIKEKRLRFWELKEEFIPSVLKNKNNLIGINVSASDLWETKNWPPEYIEKLTRLIVTSLSYEVVLIGDEKSLKITRRLNLNHPKVINLCGRTTLKELIYVIKKLNLLITPDSAPLHMALALEIPVIGLFGPTNPSRHIEKNENLFVIFKKLDCSFCYRHKCKKKECMKRISPQEVFKMIKKILKK